MAFMVSDGDFAVGIQLRDPARDYQVQGPYIGIQGEPGRSLDPDAPMGGQLVRTSARINLS
eukprot:m.278737 g.278737  ORF g.278737 m.278737 type:complete len:61 (+) comp40611_c0_seq115:272-454(+)